MTRSRIVRLAVAVVSLAALVLAPSAGTRVFQTHVDYSTGQLSMPGAVAIADVNGDTKPDLVTANQYGSASVLLGNGDGTFGTHHEYSAGGHSESNVVVTDLNGDSKPDLVLSNPVVINGQSNVSVLLGNGDGTFQTHTDYATPPLAADVAVGDLNEDGKPDIVSVNNQGNDISVFLGNGDGTFQAAVNTGTGSSPNALAIGDFNGDGHLDVFVVGAPDATVLFGKGDGTFSSIADLRYDGADWMAVGDFNGDGSPDVVGVSSTVAFVLLNDGSGTFTYNQLPYLSFFAYTVATADLNGDGHVDLLMADNSSSNIWIAYGNGDGSFQSPFSVAVGSSPLGLAVADLNGDALPDIAVSNTRSLTVSVILEQLSSDPNLSSLVPSAGTLSPSFDSGTTSYSETVATGTSSITVTPTVEDPAATVEVMVDGTYVGVTSGQPSPPISLSVGDNEIDVKGAAEDGSTKTYTIDVTREAPSSDDNLSSLAVSAGGLSPSFDAGTTSYTDQVSNATSSMTVTPTVEDSTATVQVLVNGTYVGVTSGHASPSISLPVGEKTIDVKVTAQDASTQVYEIDVTRLAPYECADTPSPPCWTTFTVDDGPPPAGLELQTFAQNGSIAVQLEQNGNVELTDDGLNVHAVVDLGSYDPVVLEATGIVDSYTETTGATNSIDIRLRPHDSSWSTSCSVGDCGTDEAPLTATHDYTAVFAGVVNDLGEASGAVKDAMRGMYAYSDAQAFTFPTYDPATGVVSLTLAAPHFKTNGSTVNLGGFEAFLPDALAEAMGVSDPSALTSSTMQLSSSEGDTGAPSIYYDDSNSPGIVVETSGGFPYSSPTFSIGTAPDHLTVTAAGSATAGTAFPVTVKAVDDLGDTVRNYTGTVSFSAGGAGATLPADYTFTAGDEGTHTFSGVKLTKAGSRTITATDTDALTGTTDAIDVSPGAPAELLDISPSTNLPFGATRDITVQVYDAYDNLATNDDSTVVSFAGSGAGAVTGLHAKTVHDGIATETVTGRGGGQVFVHETAAGLLDDGVFFDVLARNGSGTMTASPTKVKHGTAALVTLTYTAAPGGMDDGTLVLTVPAGWTAPTANPARAGYPIASIGKVSVSHRTITISNISRVGGQKVTILYDRKGTVVAPATAVGAQTWAVTERSQNSGKPAPLAAPPKITVG